MTRDICVKLVKATSETQKSEYQGPHAVPGGSRIRRQLRTAGSGT